MPLQLLVPFALLALAWLLPGQAARAQSPAQRTDYIWCVMQDSVDNRPRSIYSAVFRGDRNETQTYESAFKRYIDNDIGLGFSSQVSCSRQNSRARSQQTHDDDAAQARMRFDRRVVLTYWTY